MIAMISTEKATGRATSATARATTAPLRLAPVGACARWRRTFSTTTIEASTTMPTEKARPPRLIRLEVSPTWPMTMKLTRKVSGSEKTTISAVRSSATNRNSTRIDEQAALEQRVDHRVDAGLDQRGAVVEDVEARALAAACRRCGRRPP